MKNLLENKRLSTERAFKVEQLISVKSNVEFP